MALRSQKNKKGGGEKRKQAVCRFVYASCVTVHLFSFLRVNARRGDPGPRGGESGPHASSGRAALSPQRVGFFSSHLLPHVGLAFYSCNWFPPCGGCVVALRCGLQVHSPNDRGGGVLSCAHYALLQALLRSVAQF